MKKLKQGWAWPALSKKAHYFKADDVVSLCGRWLLVSDSREDHNHESIDNCAECKRRRAKLNA